MKKLLTLTLVLLLAFSAAGTALADTITTESSDETIVTYGVTAGFTVTIPADFGLSTTESSQTVSAAGVLIADGKQLTVTMATANFDTANSKYRVKYEDSYIAYTIKLDDTAQTSNSVVVLTVPAGTATGSATLKFQTTQDDINAATKAGTHQDTLTFTVAVGDAPVTP